MHVSQIGFKQAKFNSNPQRINDFFLSHSGDHGINSESWGELIKHLGKAAFSAEVFNGNSPRIT